MFQIDMDGTVGRGEESVHKHIPGRVVVKGDVHTIAPRSSQARNPALVHEADNSAIIFPRDIRFYIQISSR